VEQVFMQVRRVIDSGAHEVTVLFDPALGYPSRISVDPRRDVVGDERDWTATLSITRPAPATVFELVK
jgi:hypothetical protein